MPTSEGLYFQMYFKEDRKENVKFLTDNKGSLNDKKVLVRYTKLQTLNAEDHSVAKATLLF